MKMKLRKKCYSHAVRTENTTQLQVDFSVLPGGGSKLLAGQRLLIPDNLKAVIDCLAVAHWLITNGAPRTISTSKVCRTSSKPARRTTTSICQRPPMEVKLP